MTQRPENFCYAPWTNIEIMQNGRIVPCCKFVDSHYEQKFNITTNSIADYKNGRYLADIKQEFLNGACGIARQEKPLSRGRKHSEWPRSVPKLYTGDLHGLIGT